MPKKRPVKRITQVLPNVRIIPRIRFLTMSEVKEGVAATDNKVDRAIANKLLDIALSGYAAARGETVTNYKDKDEPVVVLLAPNKAADAAAHFVSEKAFETDLPTFRRIVAGKEKSSLKRAVTNLLKNLPPDESPPFPQMRELAGEREWRANLNPTNVREVLGRWVELMDKLNSMAGRGRSPLTAEKRFVGALAHYWKNELGAKIVNSRAVSSSLPKLRSSHAYEQGGLFTDFIREAAKIIPKTYRPNYWDQAIRNVIEKKL